ncbi:MAG TPA: DMT family transporter [Candidatus Cybelea sp.]|nr:DMT family transporter [Candidatus Cybelea sp.]
MTAARSTTLLAVAAAAASGVLVGSGIVATRFVVDQAGPISLALLRYAIGACCLLPALVLTKTPMRFDRRDIAPIALLGIAQFGILIALLNYALHFIPSARASLLFATMPLQTMLLAAVSGRERMTPPKTIGVLLTIAGVALALGEGIDAAAGHWLGDLAALLSAFTGAVCSVLYRPYLRKYPTLPVSAFAMLASVAFLALLANGEDFFGAWPSFTGAGWGAVIFIGLNSGVGYFLWLWALNHASPTRVTAFVSLSPITAAALGALLLGESLSLPILGGVALVVLGLVLAHKEDPRGDARAA